MISLSYFKPFPFIPPYIFTSAGTPKLRLRGASSFVYCAVQSVRGDVLGCCGDNSVLLWGQSGNLKVYLLSLFYICFLTFTHFLSFSLLLSIYTHKITFCTYYW